MDHNELLQAISSIMDKKLEPIQRDISTLKSDISGLEEGQLKTNITLENEISKKISALFDAHQFDGEKIQSIKDTVESIKEVVDTNDTLAKVNAREIRRLKEKLG